MPKSRVSNIWPIFQPEKKQLSQNLFVVISFVSSIFASEVMHIKKYSEIAEKISSFATRFGLLVCFEPFSKDTLNPHSPVWSTNIGS